ncbi:Uncharacterised protein [uncultured archaeon]|nr:Uncharacterised protein [uncultured archaeon]
MFFVRFSTWLILFLLFASLLSANTRMQYSQDGLLVTRALEIQSIQTVNPVMGVAHETQQSVITLTLSNPGSVERRNVVLAEDLAYLPSYIRLSYGIQPASSDGRTARWNLPVLQPGQSARFTITLPTVVSDGSAARAPAPQVVSDRPPAQLTVPTLSDAGQNVVVRLRSISGVPLANAAIVVSMPDGHSLPLLTDSDGRAFYTASASGFYSYSVPDFAVPFTSSTEVRSRAVVVPATVGAMVALPSADAPSPAPAPMNIDWSGLWPVAGGLLMVGFIAFGLYAYFNRSQPDDYSPLSAAPATRPSIQDMHGFGSAPSDSGPLAARAGSDEEEPSPSTPMPPAMPGASARPSPAPEDAPSSAAGSSTVPTIPANGADSAAIRARSRELIRSRREGAALSSSRPASFGETTTLTPPAETAASALSSSIQPSKASFSEQTLLPRPAFDSDEDEEAGEPSEPAESKLSDSTAAASGSASGDSVSDESEASGDSSGSEDSGPSPSSSSPRPMPSWMTRTASAPAESVEVDDEAIAKTISELEALRDELRSRSAKRSSLSASDDDSASDDSGEDDDSDNEDSPAPPSRPVSAEPDAPSELSSSVAALLNPKPADSAESTRLSDSAGLPDDEKAEMEAILSAHPASASETGSGPQDGAADESAAPEAPIRIEPVPESEDGQPPSSRAPLSPERPPAKKSSPARAPRGRPLKSETRSPPKARAREAVPAPRTPRGTGRAKEEAASAPAKRGPGRPRKEEARAKPASKPPASSKKGRMH